MWLWPTVLQGELDRFVEFANNRRMRKQKEKLLPSGVLASYAYTFPDQFGGEDCLIPVETAVVKEILDDMEQEKEALMDWGVPEEFAAEAEKALKAAKLGPVTVKNVWNVFSVLLVRMKIHKLSL